MAYIITKTKQVKTNHIIKKCDTMKEKRKNKKKIIKKINKNKKWGKPIST